jgi:regulation of enolase protein 1 (concanavalin A-like superfamily)
VTVIVPGLPFPLELDGVPSCAHSVSADGTLSLTGGPGTDLFIDPAGAAATLPDAGRLAGLPPAGDFTLAALVTVEFASVYDAGVLLVHAGPRRWAKLCLEYSPQQRPTAVTVVTREVSDDSNSFEAGTGPLWLRVTRSGRAWAFHASTDGSWWQLLRYFSLDYPVSAGPAPAGPGPASPARIGFLAQSPSGPGCTAIFEHITFGASAPGDLRDGS